MGWGIVYCRVCIVYYIRLKPDLRCCLNRSLGVARDDISFFIEGRNVNFLGLTIGGSGV